ncbi:MAG TPA: DegT/DnrJ/EryC1/StrS aminotransferase family protein [Alphaproteobacteria bacterium]|nr:DegT/DnrJ/EryC1/StrS aminotransferase family protein [Alphaproteobacteria bacterium]
MPERAEARAHGAPIAFIDLAAQRARLGARIERALAAVLAHGQCILGPEVSELEQQLRAYSGAAEAVTCANGTDALVLALMAQGIGPGDAVIVPSFTFAATAEAVALVGATPVFADIAEADFNLDPARIAEAAALARSRSLKTRAVIAVDLFGQPADYDRLVSACEAEGLALIADAAQSFGARYQGRAVGTLAPITTTSFFPAKPLGCYGDGGAVLLANAGPAELFRSLRVHGQGSNKYENLRVGLNSRLDTLQAAILLAKLEIFEEEIAARNRVAARYNEPLSACVRVPRLMPERTSVWAQYTVRIGGGKRDQVARALSLAGVPSAIYYPTPLHRQPAYRDYPALETPVSERLAREVLSLPMHPYLDEATQGIIIDAFRAALAQERA